MDKGAGGKGKEGEEEGVGIAHLYVIRLSSSTRIHLPLSYLTRP